MTSYKKLYEEEAALLKSANEEVDTLKQRVVFLQDGLIHELGGALDNEDAKAVLAAFADRAKTKDELLLLIRTLTRI